MPATMPTDAAARIAEIHDRYDRGRDDILEGALELMARGTVRWHGTAAAYHRWRTSLLEYQADHVLLSDTLHAALGHLYRQVGHEDDPCDFDHHGGCQAHFKTGSEPGKCGTAEARAFLAEVTVSAE